VHDPEHDVLYPAHFLGRTGVEAIANGFERYAVLDPSGSPKNPAMVKSLWRKFALLAKPLLCEDGPSSLANGFDDISAMPVRTLGKRAVI
jgi:hypothetical protein